MKMMGVVLCLLIAAGSAHAAVMNWDVDGDYPEGGVGSALSPIQAYNNIDGTGVNVSLYWTGNTSYFLGGYNYSDTAGNAATITLPDDDYSAIFDNLSALWYGISQPGSVSLIIQFSQPVTNVSFDIWDIDGVVGSAGVESLRIKGFLGGLGVGAVMPSSYSGGPDLNFQTVPIGQAGDGLIISNKGLYDINPPASEHRAVVGFNGPIDTIGYVFTTTQGNRGQLLGDITFVPEPATLVLLGVGGLGLIRRKR